MKDAINWFELPVVDLSRAQKFYETVLGQKLKAEDFGGMPIALFPSTQAGVGGALVLNAKRKPSAGGSLVYLNADGILDAALGRVATAGGKVLMPKTDIGDPGSIALVIDTEGNEIGLHASRA